MLPISLLNGAVVVMIVVIKFYKSAGDIGWKKSLKGQKSSDSMN